MSSYRPCEQCGTESISHYREQKICDICETWNKAQKQIDALALERDKAIAKAAQYESDWVAAKSEFGTAMATVRDERDVFAAESKRQGEILGRIAGIWNGYANNDEGEAVDVLCQIGKALGKPW